MNACTFPQMLAALGNPPSIIPPRPVTVKVREPNPVLAAMLAQDQPWTPAQFAWAEALHQEAL